MSKEYTRRELISYDCGHSQEFRNPVPRVGETLFCLRCRKDRKVIRAAASWKIRCRNCIYSRDFGLAQLNSEIAAAKHRMKYPDHVVEIRNGMAVVKVFGEQRNQTVIELFPNSDPG